MLQTLNYSCSTNLKNIIFDYKFFQLPMVPKNSKLNCLLGNDKHTQMTQITQNDTMH